MSTGFVDQLVAQLPAGTVLTGQLLDERYDHIWRMHLPLQAKAVVLPRSTEEVAIALKHCYANGQPVVIHGGLTNLVGATKVSPDEVVISLEKMNAIEEIDEQSRTMTVQAGTILEHIQQAAAGCGLLFSLNFGAKGSAQIGGIISTNAGGLRVFRYGMTRQLVLGLEAVLANGTVISSMKKIIKDNSGYDLKQLFIGSEGTLGVITRAVLKLTEAPKSRTSAFVGFDNYDKVVAFLKYMDAGLAGTLSGYELLWQKTYQAMTQPPASEKPPLPPNHRYYVLLESLGSDPEKDANFVQTLLENAFEKKLILDAAVAKNESDLRWFWTIREDVRVLSSICNHDQHFDVSLPVPKIGDYVNTVLEKLNQLPEVERAFAFGHVADGNVHFVVGKENNSATLVHQINEIVYRPLKVLGGSVSAEHGIGIDKKQYLSYCRTTAEIDLMKTLKKTLDPKEILNRGKVLDL